MFGGIRIIKMRHGGDDRDADGGGGCIHTYSHTHMNAYRHTERQPCTQRYRHTYITFGYSRRCSRSCRDFCIFIGLTLVIHRRMHAHTLTCMQACILYAYECGRITGIGECVQTYIRT